MKKRHTTFIDRTGEKHTTNEGYEITIVGYRSCKDCDIQFLNGHVLTKTHYAHIKKGNIKNPHHISVFGVGYFGVGQYKAKVQDKHTTEYRFWKAMMERGYSKTYSDKLPTYKGCYVSKEWHNFQNFAKWFNDNYNFETMQGWHLDKDIMVKGNKIYSPETCCFVPREINNLFRDTKSCRGLYPIGVHIKDNSKMTALLSKNGKQEHLGTFDTPEEAFEAYKTAKESYVKDIANKWKDQITPQIYKAMCDYKVEITD